MLAFLAGLGAGGGEEDLAVLDVPAPGAGELDDGAFGIEEEERLGGRYGQGRVGALAAAGDLGADLRCEDLPGRKRHAGFRLARFERDKRERGTGGVMSCRRDEGWKKG